MKLFHCLQEDHRQVQLERHLNHKPAIQEVKSLEVFNVRVAVIIMFMAEVLKLLVNSNSFMVLLERLVQEHLNGRVVNTQLVKEVAHM